MTVIARTAGFALALAAPALVAVGVATAHADTSVASTGPSASTHQVFPNQHNVPVPGSSTHHHHQNNHAK
ncbi:hypothetical protein [Mycolicibacterium houstonense]|uniref:hypothetical protein n=1 Tax=Mycolicibacterium houstonense TaxID=146021 RepID=UPI0008353405|nr:hypothetical protein [Mycolicibacterium houstonense]